MKKRDFLTLADFSSEEILDMLDEAVRLKQKMDNNEIYTPLKGRSASMIFQKDLLELGFLLKQEFHI